MLLTEYTALVSYDQYVLIKQNGGHNLFNQTSVSSLCLIDRPFYWLSIYQESDLITGFCYHICQGIESTVRFVDSVPIFGSNVRK